MNTVTLHVIGKVFYFSAVLCGDQQPCDQNFIWYNEFPTVEACMAEKERRITWLQKNYRFRYVEPPEYICSESVTS